MLEPRLKPDMVVVRHRERRHRDVSGFARCAPNPNGLQQMYRWTAQRKPVPFLSFDGITEVNSPLNPRDASARFVIESSGADSVGTSTPTDSECSRPTNAPPRGRSCGCRSVTGRPPLPEAEMRDALAATPAPITGNEHAWTLPTEGGFEKPSSENIRAYTVDVTCVYRRK